MELSDAGSLRCCEVVHRHHFRPPGGSIAFLEQEDATPILDRVLALAAAGLVAVGLPFGLGRVWKDFRANPVCVVLAVAASGYLASLGLRLVPAAWETANRARSSSSSGSGSSSRWPAWSAGGRGGCHGRAARRSGRLRRPARGRHGHRVVLHIMLAQTTAVAAGGVEIHPQGTPPRPGQRATRAGRRFAADASNARLLAAYADEFAIAGTNPDVQSVIRDPKLDDWHVRLLRRLGIRYILVDRRECKRGRTCRLLLHDRHLSAFVESDVRPEIRPQVRSAGRESALRQRQHRRLRRKGYRMLRRSSLVILAATCLCLAVALPGRRRSMLLCSRAPDGPSRAAITDLFFGRSSVIGRSRSRRRRPRDRGNHPRRVAPERDRGLTRISSLLRGGLTVAARRGAFVRLMRESRRRPGRAPCMSRS